LQSGESDEVVATAPTPVNESETSPEAAEDKPNNHETWTDVNLNEDSDAGREVAMVDEERGEKPVQEISVVRVPTDYQPTHSVTRPDELPIKV